jgi:hypothetical protein
MKNIRIVLSLLALAALAATGYALANGSAQPAAGKDCCAAGSACCAAGNACCE